MTRHSDHEEYNPFLLDLALSFETQLIDRDRISRSLRRELKNSGVPISRTAVISTQATGTRWLIKDTDNKSEYVVAKKEGKLAVYRNIHVVNQIVDRDLCVRCGACEPACPVDIIRFNDRAYPYLVNDEACITTCTRCLKVCPGEVVDYSKLDAEMFGRQPHPDSVTGIARRTFVSFASDEKLRQEATSGGFVTHLLQYMMDKGLIDGALILGSSADGNGWREEPVIARTVEELRKAKKSKYMVVPFLKPLAEMERIEGNYAVVALPCYIHALKKYQRVSRKLQERIKLIIGLYCNVAFEPYMLDELCEFQKVNKNDVANLDFRHGTWPGGVYAEFRDGSKKKVLKLQEMKDEFNTLKMLYTPTRCNLCTDFSAEYADIAVGDPWLRGPDGKLLFEDNRTTVLTRTELADRILDMAAADGYIKLKEIPLKTWMVNFESSARYKRDFVPKNIWLRELLGLPVPKYNRAIGRGKASGFASMVLKNAILAMARFKWFKKTFLFIVQTRPAIAYYAWNRKRKARKFAAAYPRLETFVGRLAPTEVNRTEKRATPTSGVMPPGRAKETFS